MTTSTIFDSFIMGDLELPNRIVMAPLTRNRALHDGDVPHALNTKYYAQRASAGLIISEAAQISPEGKGYAWTPGIYSTEQVNGWQQITNAVHAKNGRIFIQLWHVGRISHTSLQLDGLAPVAPSALVAQAQTFDGEKFVATSTPRSLNVSEIERIVEDYRKAAVNAKTAGFDGVEIHAANGFLIDQFLQDSSNKRTDAYGGSIKNRVRFLIEVVEAIREVWPSGRIGIRLSPFSNINDINDSDPMALFTHVISKINDYDLAYIHMIEGEAGVSRDLPKDADIEALRALFNGIYMANNGYDKNLASKSINKGKADLIAFGRLFISNPDLVERLAIDAPLNDPDPNTMFGGGAAGYTDYPTLQKSAAV